MSMEKIKVNCRITHKRTALFFIETSNWHSIKWAKIVKNLPHVKKPNLSMKFRLLFNERFNYELIGVKMSNSYMPWFKDRPSEIVV